MTLGPLLLASSFAHAGPIPVTSTSSGALHLTSGTDYFGWSGESVLINSMVSSTTPVSITNLGNGGVQDVYNAIISVTGFQPNLAGTMTFTSNPAAAGSDSISIAMTYANFGLTTTLTETLNNVNMANPTPGALLSTLLSSPYDQITITSNWGENATFGIDGSMNSSNGNPNVAIAPEASSFSLLAAGLALIGFQSFVSVARRKFTPRTRR